ncbi:MAG TPA: CRISPR-associated protein Csx11, partial [Peptococcaceae bacterium]|nr:CRISPR-associated protein Csx11 [Peptococcaceae bacterium]
MSCCDDLKIICSNRKTILIGEIGALLLDIGKAHPSFINDLSVDGVKSGQPHYHAWGIDDILSSRLLEYLKNDRLKVKLGDEKSVYEFIRDHHSKDDKEIKSALLKYLISCDRKDSADDKGIVRRKQSIKNTVISSPFGSPKEVINLDSLQKRFDELDNQLGDMVERYINHGMDLIELRNAIRDFLKSAFSHALGETRIPANDVTLWDHSFSTASLFKSTLAGKVLGEEPKNRWRLFGIIWNGREFIKRGRKIADIQKRSEIIQEIKIGLIKKFEIAFPIGNALYEDINGIYFSFPGLELPKAKKLAEQCAQKALKVIYEKSDNELWPFFTLSKASSSLTIIAGELKFAAQKRKVPRMTPVLFVEGSEEHFFNNSQLEPSEAVSYTHL